ncbi:divergent polysaccharide deacetylase family protein [Desulfosarcina sp.]|uniref:divergent polysaccharide deacetylase family protein n=1 Tax=Desulfosarcina sp. TaxID=2027861 RepID=UPI0029B4F8F6|nr:divergent polysaccharide deacetylase family protein [Desulfosarcina sp.]MDX2454978.1 divergent polysaccharide deacetylase family protein [Desulfosarcina sp.]MDX2492553.1 divergent polysaccharide deacetylase family protein [Desulfosarcina sp.]
MDRRTFLAKSASFLMGGLLASRIPVSAGIFSPVAHPSRIALIIDDIGFNLRRAELFLEADIPITFSVLPRVCWSVESAMALHARGHEIMLHQPMEPFDAEVDPGPGAIFVDDRPECIHQVVAENIATLPHVVGVNNHMGSRYTQQPKKMGQALDVVRNRGLFFVDSMTTGHSTAYTCARQMGVSSKRRDLFLDTQQDVSSVIRQMKRLQHRARKHGNAIGIGHPRPETAEGIMRFLETPESRDVTFVYISQML